MRVVQQSAEITPEARQGTERLLVVELEALQRATRGVDRGGDLERGVVRHARGQQAVRQSGGVVRAGLAQVLDIGADVLVEVRRAQQRILGEVPLGAYVVSLRTERLQQRVAGGDRAQGGIHRAAGRQVGQLRTRHHLGRTEAEYQLVGEIPGHVQRRQPVLVAVVHRDLGTAGSGQVAGRLDVGLGVTHADVAAQRPVHQVDIEVHLQVAGGVFLDNRTVVAARIAVGDAGQAEIAARHAGIAVAVDVEQLRELVQVRNQPARRDIAAHAAAEAGQQTADVGQGGACRQCGYHGLAGAAELEGRVVVLLPAGTRFQRDAWIGDEIEVGLEGFEDVGGTQRADADFRAGRIGRRRTHPLPCGRVADVERIGDQRLAIVVAEIPAVAIDVLDVEGDRGLGRVLEIGFRAAADQAH